MKDRLFSRTPESIDPVRDVTNEPGRFLPLEPVQFGVHPAWIALAGLIGGLLGLVSTVVGAWWLL